MSDDGYANGEVIDSPTVNSYVVGVTIVEGESAAPQAAPAKATAARSYDPGEHTVDEVQAYLAKHPDERDAVVAAEKAGKNRVTLTETQETPV